MPLRFAALTSVVAAAGIAGFASLASADNDDLKCTTAEKEIYVDPTNGKLVAKDD